MEITFAPTETEFLRRSRAVLWEKRKVQIFIYSILFLVVLAFIFKNVVGVIISALIFFLLFRLLFKSKVKRTYKKDGGQQQTYRLADDGLHVVVGSEGAVDATLKWNAVVTRVAASKQFLLFYLNNRSPLFIPKRAFTTQHDAIRFLKCAESYLK